MLISLFWILILVTFFCCCVPTLFIPRTLLRKMQVPLTEPVLFARLLGAASLALTLHYFLGVLRVQSGRDPSDIVVIGLIHCGMSSAIVWRYALHGHYRDWPWVTRAYVYATGALLTMLTLALLVVGLWYG